MKYIIELEDEPMIANSFHQEVDELWKAKGFNSLVFDKYGLDRLTPYTEPDRKAIEDEVWENTWKMFMTPEDFGATMGDSYSEAKAKYEVWKKQKEEVHVGDEVTAKTDTDKDMPKGIVTYNNPEQSQFLVIKSDGTFSWWHKGGLRKTGRHFDEVERLLERMKAE